jgi:hypothetical protein
MVGAGSAAHSKPPVDGCNPKWGNDDQAPLRATRLWKDEGMARMVTRRLGPIGVALTAYDVWRRIPKQYRRRIVAEVVKQGPRLAKEASRYYRSRRPKL